MQIVATKAETKLMPFLMILFTIHRVKSLFIPKKTKTKKIRGIQTKKKNI